MKQFAWVILLLGAQLAQAWTLVGQELGGWQTRRLSVYVNPVGCGVEETALINAIDKALTAWNGVPTANIELVREPQTVTTSVAEFLASQAPHVPLILCDSNFSANNGVEGDVVPATTRVSGSGNLTYGGVLLNAESGKNAELTQLTEAEFVVTLAHEVGHVLGLGHSSSKEALMYYSIADKPAPILTEDDTEGLTFLYPKNETTLQPFGCAAVHADSANRNYSGVGWFVWIVVLNIALARMLMRRGFRRSQQCRRASWPILPQKGRTELR